MAKVALAALLASLTFVPSAIPAQDVAPPVLRAGTPAGEMRIDGRLDELAWMAADSISDLTEVEPQQGGRPSGRTVVRVLADDRAIIVGIMAHDADPSRIVSYAVQRDAPLASEDHIRFILDTFGDGQSGYIFAINPAGARFDALIGERGKGENANWDAIWEAATTRTDAGWSVEIRIPIQSLMFKKGKQDWGFNIERRIQRLQETSRWASAALDIKLGQTSRAGVLTGLPQFGMGLGLSVRPSLTTGVEQLTTDADRSGTGELSLDVTQRIGANLLGSLTINTDFAETEVDARRTNLTRFPLLYPEKRTFFLEGADIFDFGIGMESAFRQTDLVAFNSRRIGLLGGREVGISTGGKLNGQIGRTMVGALVAATDLADGVAPASTVGVVRLKQNVLEESSIGAIASFGDPNGISDSWMVGADVTYQTSRLRGNKNFLLGAWALTLNRADLSGDRTAAGFKIDYPNDKFDVAFTFKHIGENFQPSLGYVARTGVNVANFNANYRHRPDGGPIRLYWYQFQPYVFLDTRGGWESYRIFMTPVQWFFESGEKLEINLAPQGDRPNRAFEVAPGVLIPPGNYRFMRNRVEFTTAAKRRLSGKMTLWLGSFYDGWLQQIILTSVWNPSRLLTLELGGERNIGNLPQGDFTLDLLNSRLRLNLSPDLQATGFFQYDTQSKTFGANSRVRWTFHPQGDVFVVYNHNLRNSLDHWSFESNQLLIKLQYALRY